MSDKKLESIKNLMAIADLESSAKTELLKLVMSDVMDVSAETKITFKDGLYHLESSKKIGTFNAPQLVENFRIVDGKRRFVGKRTHVDYENIISEYFYNDNGVEISKAQYDKKNDSYTIYPNIGNSQTESFADFPSADGSNLDQLATKHFKKWLSDQLIGAMKYRKVSKELALISYGSTYKEHLAWIETFCKCKGFTLEQRVDYHYITWP